MNAGKLRHRVIVQEYAETIDSFGGSVKEWSERLATNASIEPLTAREFMHAQQTKSDVTHKVTLRYTPGIVPKMRLLFGTRILHIEAVRNIGERGIELELLCKETL